MKKLKVAIFFFILLIIPSVSYANEFNIAHIREQGQDIIIIPLDSSFQSKTQSQRNQIIFALQLCARSAGLAGRVVVMWEHNSNVMYIAPQQWHSFFNSIDLVWVAQNINRTLTCN